MKSQAQRVIDAFGGAYNLAKALKTVGHTVAPATIYRWTYPAPKGRGGYIPGEHIEPIRLAAAVAENTLVESDLLPITK